VITGGTSGIGQVTAETLAAMGARIILVARDGNRAEATLRRLRNIAPQVNHTVHLADLSQVNQTKRVGQEIAAREPRVDVLINNAGALFGRRQVTPSGLELTFATNHVSYFVLTQELLPRLAASQPARIINTSSEAHRGAKLDFSDLQSESSYRGFSVYGRSKLCNILFTRELAHRLAGSDITANCLHPGFVRTRFGDQSGGWLSRAIGLAKYFAISMERGADTLIYLASSSEVAGISGAYFYKRSAVQPANESLVDLDASKLWTATSDLVRRGLETAGDAR